LSLTVEERETLERWARRPKSAQALAQRSRIILECAAVKPNTVVARKLGLTHQTVGKWRQRFLERRLEGLLDEPRPGAPRQVGDAQVERVVRLTLESTPADATHLEHPRDGQAQRVESDHGQPHLAGLCVAAAPGGGFQALQRPTVH
jgi:transposase-like protein